MKKLSLALLSTVLLIAPAFAQDAQEKIQLSVTRQQLQVIGNGLMEMPYKNAADVMGTLQLQLNAHEEAAKAKAAEAAKAAEPKTEEKPPAAKPAK